ncbi:MAG: coproporphyrinogen dehydrogenase HemZ [Bacillota bacterium]|nr:coproporphyrinogen dehydrogenase HemZ [Bacillota bacterium]
MKLYLYGHDYKYAAEQMLLTLYPAERPEYTEGAPKGERAELKLSYGREFVTATCKLVLEDKAWQGRSAFKKALITDEISRDKLCQRAIKNAFYRAALSSGHKKPAWGALTGVRPGKVFTNLMEQYDADSAMSRFISEYDVTPERAALCRDTSMVTKEVEASLEEKDICLYVGIPFCPTRCNYCSFVSQSVEKSMKLIFPFMDALIKELDAVAETVNKLGLRVISIYMGGGTPTTLTPEQLERLCSRLEEKFDLSDLREYTVEAGRPDTITEEKLRVLKAHGVDRVSVNPQTMSDYVLEAIGRKHTAQDIVDALALVRKVGGMAVNMDLIAGLTTDTVESFEKTLDTVLSLAPENITVHTLSLKKGSRITLEGSAIPTAAEVGRMLDIAGEKLRGADYAPYYLYRQKFMSGGFENVGWAKQGYVNLYNVCIMEELCSIIAMGGGGSTKLVAKNGGKSIRIFAPKYPMEYINGIEKTCEAKQGIIEFYDSQED